MEYIFAKTISTLQMQQIYCYQYSTMPLESQNKFSRSKPGMKRKLLKSKKHFAQDAHYVYLLAMKELLAW